jgi:hypothetical protein
VPFDRPNIIPRYHVKSFNLNTERRVFLGVAYPYKNEALESLGQISLCFCPPKSEENSLEEEGVPSAGRAQPGKSVFG